MPNILCCGIIEVARLQYIIIVWILLLLAEFKQFWFSMKVFVVYLKLQIVVWGIKQQYVSAVISIVLIVHALQYTNAKVDV